MSTQSGIKASEELHSVFRQFTDDKNRALILEIVDESCQPGKVVAKGGTFDEDLSTISSHLSETQARYIIVKPDDPGQRYVFVSFVPDAAPVRSKMLYASSTNTVHRELGGTNKFGTSIFWTELDEVSAKGWKTHVDHEAAVAPLTEEEESLQDTLNREVEQMGSRQSDIHRLHIAGSSSSGSASPAARGSGGLAFAVDDNVHDALHSLKGASSSAAVGLHIDVASEKVILGKKDTSIHADNLGSGFIDESKPQYTLYKHLDDNNTESVVFIYTCPSGSKIKERMVYASNRESVLSTVRTIFNVDKVIEATDGSEISEVAIIRELTPSVPSSSASSSTGASRGFARPKRPGRR